MSGASERSQAFARFAAGGALALLIGYTALIYYGVGPFPRVVSVPWWHTRGFLIETWLMGVFGDHVGAAIAGLTVPAVLLAAGVFLASGSAVARTVSLTAIAATMLFLFYGLREPGPRIWTFFGWRGSAVMLLVALVAGAAALAPLLAGSWLRRGWAVRLALYLPIVAVVIAGARNATGTNPALAFNISPWPVVTVFGLQVLATLTAGLLSCAALGLAALAHRRRRPALFALGALGAFAVPVAWIHFRLGGGPPLLWTTLALAGVALAIRAAASPDWIAALRTRAGHTAIGAVLVAAPILAGENWVQLDYRLTRDGRAQVIIDALGAYFEREGVYPETLAELVAAKDLTSIPSPQIGFRFLERPVFTYQNFGTDYLLEFAAPGWVQCAYSPPWEDERSEDGDVDSPDPEDGEIGTDEIDLEEEDPEDTDWLPGVWSCPTKPPELW